MSKSLMKMFDLKNKAASKKIDRVFQNQLESIVLELNTYLYDDGGKTA